LLGFEASREVEPASCLDEEDEEDEVGDEDEP